MLSLIKLDIFKILRSIPFYLGLAVSFLYSISSLILLNTKNRTQTSLSILILSTFFFLVICIYTVITICTYFINLDLKTNTIRNIISKGVDRTKYYISKILMIFAILTLFSLICQISIVALKHSNSNIFNELQPFIAQSFPRDFEFIYPYYIQIFKIFILSCFVVSVCIILKSSKISLVVIFLFGYIKTLIVTLIFEKPLSDEILKYLLSFDFFGSVLGFGIYNKETILLELCVQFIWAIAVGPLGLWAIRKTEL